MLRPLDRSQCAVRALVPCVALFAAACGGTDFGDTPAPNSQGIDAQADDGIPSLDAIRQEASSTDGLDAQRADTLRTDAASADGGAVEARAPDADVHSDADAHAAVADAHVADVSVSDSGVTDVVVGNVDARDAGLDGSTDAGDGSLDRDASDGGLGLLGAAKKFAVLAGATITITPSPPLTAIAGDVGVSPGTAIVTLAPGQPTGNIHAGDPVALQAQTDLTTAYNTLAAMPCLPANDRTGVDLGGKTLAPGVYCFPNTSAGITGDLVLDAQLNPNAMWVIQVGSTLTTATNATVTVINGGSACNVYWQIGSSATLGTGTKLVGNIVALTSISMVTGSTVLVGRALARNGSVVLDGDTISAASCQ